MESVIVYAGVTDDDRKTVPAGQALAFGWYFLFT